jgi:integrase
MDQAVALIEAASQERPRAPVHPGLRPQEPRPAALMYAYIVVSLATGLRTEEIRELWWNHVVAWADGQWLPVTSAGWEHEQFAVLVWRSVREDGETKTELSRRSLELPKVAVQALMEWQLAQADERLAADIRWHDTGLVFTTGTGTSLAAGHVRRMFKNVCKAAGIGESWTPRELRHSFASQFRPRYGHRGDRPPGRPQINPDHRDRLPARTPASNPLRCRDHEQDLQRERAGQEYGYLRTARPCPRWRTGL